MKIFLHPLQQKKIFLPSYSCNTANSSASSIPQTGSTGINFSLIDSIYTYVESNDPKLELKIMS